MPTKNREARTTVTFDKRYPLTSLHTVTPRMPVGRKPTMIGISRFGLERIFLAYNDTTAIMAPSWINSSKLLTNSDCGMESRRAARIMCPVEEMGRNSVTPSTIARIQVVRRFI